jgi:hypothetical protein
MDTVGMVAIIEWRKGGERAEYGQVSTFFLRHVYENSA